MDTKLANGVLRPIKDTDVIHKHLEDYVRKDLRDRFDDEKDNVSAIHIIDETRFRFEFDDLAKEMIRDFCIDEDCTYLWKLHEQALKQEENNARVIEMYRDKFLMEVNNISRKHRDRSTSSI